MIRTQIKELLLSSLYGVSDTYFRKTLEKIVDTNNRINNFVSTYPTGSCIYKNTRYCLENNALNISVRHRNWKLAKTYPLDPSLHVDMAAYLDLRQTLERERPVVGRFLTILLNFCRAPEDLQTLLGDYFYGEIKPYAYYFDGQKQPEINMTQFKQDNQHYIDMMYRRYLDNVLMTGIYNEN